MNPNLIDRLEKRLKKPLPGAVAHEKAKPLLPDGTPIKFPTPAGAIPGAVLILLYYREGNWYFPLIQRPTYEGIHSGQMGLPGGKREPLDKDLYETAVREAREEIGILSDQLRVIGALSPFFVAVSNHNILPVIAVNDGTPEFIPDHVEVDEVIEAKVEQILDHRNFKTKEIVTQNGFKLQAPYFDINEKVVWGATAGMLSEFVEIMKEL